MEAVVVAEAVEATVVCPSFSEGVAAAEGHAIKGRTAPA